jgi:hypothetical protein
MRPVRLRIRKKVLVPTKHAIAHQYRSDWITVGVIDYFDSANFFSKIKTDAQFAYYLLKKYGKGIYSVLGFKKGREGFYAFLKINCMEDRFCRMPKVETQEQKENRELSFEKRRLNRQLKQNEDLTDDQKDLIHENLEEVNADLEINKEIGEIDSIKRGPAPYLKSTLPIYREHEYAMPGDENSMVDNKTIEAYNIW